MANFVLDASLTMAWCFDDEATVFTDSVLVQLQEDSSALVPMIWPLEVVNVLLVAERRGRVEINRVEDFTSVLRRLPIQVQTSPPPHLFDVVLPLGRTQGLSAYDTSYLDLALQEGLPLASMDKRLREAARHTGVVLLDELP